MNENRVVIGSPHPVFSAGVVSSASRHLYVSGQLALDEDGGVIAPGDTREQSRVVLEKIQALVEEAGGSMNDIIKLTAFLTDITRLDEYTEVRRQFLPEPRPASTAVEVSALVHPELVIEVEAVVAL